MIKTLDEWLVEATLKPRDVFKTKDKTGDLANTPFYVKSIKNKEITIVLPDGSETLTTLKMLNIDVSSIHPYDPKQDIQFKF